MKIISLDKLQLNKSGKIDNISCETNIKRRLLDLGIVRGTQIQNILNSPLGGINAYWVRGTTIAIRDENAKEINIII